MSIFCFPSITQPVIVGYSSNSHSPSPPSSSNAFSLLSSEQDNPSTSGCRLVHGSISVVFCAELGLDCSRNLSMRRIHVFSVLPGSSLSHSAPVLIQNMTFLLRPCHFFHLHILPFDVMQQRAVSQGKDSEGAFQDPQGAKDALAPREEE